jgi:hypothetical protein
MPGSNRCRNHDQAHCSKRQIRVTLKNEIHAERHADAGAYEMRPRSVAGCFLEVSGMTASTGERRTHFSRNLFGAHNPLLTRVSVASFLERNLRLV